MSDKVGSTEELMKQGEWRNDLDDAQVSDVRELLEDFEDCFFYTPRRTYLNQHNIDLISDEPFCSRLYRVAHRQKNIKEKEIKRMLEPGGLNHHMASTCFTNPGRSSWRRSETNN